MRTTRAPQPPAGHNGSSPPPPVPRGMPAPVASAPRTRRRPALIGLGLALVALGALGSAWVVTTVGKTQPVLAVARDVAQGQVLAREHLAVAHISADSALRPVPAASIDEVLGKRAAGNLPAGSLLATGSYTATLVPGPGQSLVGVALKRTQLPSAALSAGDRVRIISTPGRAQGDPSAAPAVVEATVDSAKADDNSDLTIVDVIVPSAVAGELTARAATGDVGLVLDSRAG